MSTASKTLTLTIGERIKALEMFNLFRGDMDTQKSLLDNVKQLPITDEEWTEAGLVKTPIKDKDGQDTEQWKWNEVTTKEVTFDPKTVDYLKAKIKEKSDAGEITLADVALASLNEKL